MLSQIVDVAEFEPALEPIVGWVMFEFVAAETCTYFAFAALDESQPAAVVALAAAIEIMNETIINTLKEQSQFH